MWSSWVVFCNWHRHRWWMVSTFFFRVGLHMEIVTHLLMEFVTHRHVKFVTHSLHLTQASMVMVTTHEKISWRILWDLWSSWLLAVEFGTPCSNHSMESRTMEFVTPCSNHSHDWFMCTTRDVFPSPHTDINNEWWQHFFRVRFHMEIVTHSLMEFVTF